MPQQPAQTSRDSRPRLHHSDGPCPLCCGHGVALVWFCAWCAEVDEFGSSDFGVWGPEQVMACEHTLAAAS